MQCCHSVSAHTGLVSPNGRLSRLQIWWKYFPSICNRQPIIGQEVQQWLHSYGPVHVVNPCQFILLTNLIEKICSGQDDHGIIQRDIFPQHQLYNRTQLGFLTVCKGAWWFLGSALNSIIIIIIINHMYWIKWHCGKRALWPYNKLIYSSDVQSISWWPFSHRSCYASVPIWRRH